MIDFIFGIFVGTLAGIVLGIGIMCCLFIGGSKDIE